MLFIKLKHVHYFENFSPQYDLIVFPLSNHVHKRSIDVAIKSFYINSKNEKRDLEFL